MNLLLDTHVLLWWAENRNDLHEETRQALAAGNRLVYVSAATIWEFAIKKASGKLETPDDLSGLLQANRFTVLPITMDHALTAGALPLHHRDPFDRMLVAQAQVENLTLATRDPVFAKYGVRVMMA